MITIVLADDEKLIRAGLKKILLENIDIPLEIIEAKNGEEALELCKNKTFIWKNTVAPKSLHSY